MFKISKININTPSGKQELDFEKNQYVYGANNKGKTALLNLIDYILGSDSFELSKYQGLDNIESVECKIIDSKEELWLKRDASNFYYKKSIDDGYIKVLIDEYKEKIEFFLNKGNNDFIKSFYDVFSEAITYRSLTFLNNVEEKGLGDLSCVFTRAREIRFAIKIKDIMTFLFNYDNVKKIQSLKEILALKEERLKLLKNIEQKNRFYLNIINENLNALNISASVEINEKKSLFLKFKDSFERKKSEVIKEDLPYLMRISHSLSEELKLQENLKTQSDKIINRNKNIEILLSDLNLVIDKAKNYSKYQNNIRELIANNQANNALLSVKNYNDIISKLQERKDEVDKKIKLLSSGMNKNDYLDTIKRLRFIEDAFLNVDSTLNYDELEKLNKDIADLKKSISTLSSEVDQIEMDSFNKTITTTYKKLEEKIGFVKDDFKVDGFGIEFNPYRLSLSGIKNGKKIENGSFEKYYYNPGSMARQTCWQICAYLALFKYIKNKFKDGLLMPLLVIDGLNQPFDMENNSNNYKSLLNLIYEEAAEYEIQVVNISIIKPEKGTFIDISKGLNPAHKNIILA